MGGMFERIARYILTFKKLDNIIRDLMNNQLVFVNVSFQKRSFQWNF